VVAGIAGVIMLIAPASTDRYFSWPIGPPAVAATVGAFYVASALVFGTILFLQRGRVTGAGDRLRPWASSRRAPVALMALSGRFLGCWAAFLAVLAALAAIRDRWNEARTPLLALAAWPAAALLAAVTRYGDLDSDRRVAYVIVVVIVLAVSAPMLISGRDARRRV
jgi:hypothetical protein